jgi:4-hydroxy-tetrahydrodipicolinate synthase
MEQTLSDGVYAAVMTPFNPDLSVNITEFFNHCKRLLEKGCAGVVLFGTTGEGPSLSHSERLEILEEVLKLGLAPEKTIVSNGATGVMETVELAHKAHSLGISSYLIAPPTFYKNNSEIGIINYYKTIITRIAVFDESRKMKILLYHIPQFTGVPITHAVVKALHEEFPNTVIGLKESEGNISYAKELIKSFPNFKVFVGYERQMIEAVRSGGAGTICGLVNVYPDLICSLFKQAKTFPENSGNPPELDKFVSAMGKHNFVVAFKAIMESRNGNLWRVVRPPLSVLSETDAKQFIDALREAHLEPGQ